MRAPLSICLVLASAGSALAQSEFYAITADRRIGQFDPVTGERYPSVVVEVPVYAACRADDELRILDDDDRLHVIDRHDGGTQGHVVLTGRPFRYEPRAIVQTGNRSLLAILSPPSGDDWLFRVDMNTWAYSPVGPTGITGIRGITDCLGGYGLHVLAITEAGEIYTINTSTGGATYETSVWPADAPFGAIVRDDRGLALASGRSLWAFDGPALGWRVVRWNQYHTVIDLVMLPPLGWGPCYPDCDTSVGVGVLDIFDFLCFQNRFSQSHPYACDCDLSTGTGVCDIFDFLCFQNAFARGCP